MSWCRVEERPDTGSDLMILPIEGDTRQGFSPKAPTVFLGTKAAERSPMFSPDGRWIAYHSNEIGPADVYVRPFPGPGGKWRISTGGGGQPRWSATAHELLFLNSGSVMYAPYDAAGDSFRAGKPQLWSPTSYRSLGFTVMYDLHPDGKRLAIGPAMDQGSVVQDKVVFFFGFGDYLKKIAPVGK